MQRQGDQLIAMACPPLHSKSLSLPLIAGILCCALAVTHFICQSCSILFCESLTLNFKPCPNSDALCLASCTSAFPLPLRMSLHCPNNDMSRIASCDTLLGGGQLLRRLPVYKQPL